MKKKSDCEPAIRRLSTDWFNGLADPKPKQPSFSAFKRWAIDKGYGEYFEFSSTAGPDYDAEMWFDQELGQAWRN